MVSVAKKLGVKWKRETRKQNECMASRDPGESGAALWTMTCFRHFSPVTSYSHTSSQHLEMSFNFYQEITEYRGPPSKSVLGRESYIYIHKSVAIEPCLWTDDMGHCLKWSDGEFT